MAEDTTLHAGGERTHVVNPRGLIQPGRETRQYRLPTPTFTGVEDVEQFASEFRETWDVAQWPPRVALAKLRRALTGEAKQYGHRRNAEEILAALRARFGITAPDARSRLHRLLRREDTPLPDHALAVQRLARIAYGDHRDLHSFPTRRSSDLRALTGEAKQYEHRRNTEDILAALRARFGITAQIGRAHV